MNEDKRLKQLSPLEFLCKRLGEVYGSSLNKLLDEIETERSLFNLPEFKRIAKMRNEGSLKAFSKKEIEDFFNAHDRSSKSTNS